MTRAADVVRLSGDEYDRLMDEREILRQEATRAWREVDFIAKERTEHLEWRTKLANDLDECERMRDTLARTLNKRENDLMLLRNAVDAMMAPLRIVLFLLSTSTVYPPTAHWLVAALRSNDSS
jgi:chromosome segregation ATPase